VFVKYLFAALAIFLLLIGCLRLVRDGWRYHPQSATWLVVAVIFAIASAWLFSQQG
jgi:uncharacterized membrane protein